MLDKVAPANNVESPSGDSRDLLSASQSSIELWENPLDDEDWNDA